MIEATRALGYTYTRLANDATLLAIPIGGVFSGVADEGTATPYIVISQQSGVDALGANVTRILSDMLFKIEVVGRADQFMTLQTVADRVDFLLTKASGTTADGRILSVYRTQTLVLEEVDAGIKYSRIIGIFRYYVTPLAA